MTDKAEARTAIRARILELLESGPVPEDDLPAAVAVSPDERQQVDRWRLEVRGVADTLCAEGEIERDSEAKPPVFRLPAG